MPTIPWATAASVDVADRLPHAALRTRIAWLCYLTRAAAVGWVAWMLFAMVRVWTDPATLMGLLGRYLNADLGAITPSEVVCGLTAQVVAWMPMAVVAYCIWHLFGCYLRGHIFTADAAAWVQRVGIAGLITVAISIVARRTEWLILTSHSGLPFSTRLLTQLVVPNNLLEVLFSLFVLAIGRVFSAAVQIADDNASIV